MIKKQEHYVQIGTQWRMFCTRICDECGKEDTVDYWYAKKAKEKRNNIDLCRHCSGTRKYKQTIRGENNKNWKHGLNCGGYRLMTTDSGRKCFEHVFVYEEFLGKRIAKGQTLHHIDMNKTNNVLENLFLFEKRKDHSKCHSNMEVCGFCFLGTQIWFDTSIKSYVLSRPFVVTSNIKANKSILDKYSKYKKYLITPHNNTRPYYSISVKQKDGSFASEIFHTSLVKEAIGRKLKRNECVHHIDGNALNNNIDNLFLMTLSDHAKCHKSLQSCVAELYKQGIITFEDGIYGLRK